MSIVKYTVRYPFYCKADHIMAKPCNCNEILCKKLREFSFDWIKTSSFYEIINCFMFIDISGRSASIKFLTHHLYVDELRILMNKGFKI